jgi:hypothetical protein
MGSHLYDSAAGVVAVRTDGMWSRVRRRPLLLVLLVVLELVAGVAIALGTSLLRPLLGIR